MTEPTIERLLKDLVTAHELPSARAAVWAAPDDLRVGAVSSRLDGDRAVSPAGRFRIGSITKTFTSALTWEAIDSGMLVLGDEAVDYVPVVPGGITVRMLLEHTSGLGDPLLDASDEFLGLVLGDLARHWSTGELVDLVVRQPPAFPAGTEYRYANADAYVLAAICEQITGRGYASQVEELAARTGLTDTRLDAGTGGGLLEGWIDLGTGTCDTDITELDNTSLVTAAGAAGGLTSTLDDLVRWGRTYLGEGLVGAERWEQVATSCRHSDDEMCGHAGLGVFRYPCIDTPLGPVEVFGHSGNLPGSSAIVAAAAGSVVAVHVDVQHAPTDALVNVARRLLHAAAAGRR